VFFRSSVSFLVSFSCSEIVSPTLLLSDSVATSYNAFWEGRKYISSITSEIRNLTRLIWITIPEVSQTDHNNKIIHIKLLLGFAYATRHALLEESGVFQDFEKLLPEDMKSGQDFVGPMPVPFQIIYRVFYRREYD
jgi:predicted membrane chloride channel (bestrophin family)